MKLPKNIIKRYGISKKAWSVFRGQKTGGTTMARKRSGSKKKYNFSRKSSNSSISFWHAVGYGVARAPINSVVRQFAPQIPFVGQLIGQFGDEAALGVTAWALKKWGPAGLRPYADFAMKYEAANVARQFTAGGLNLATGGNLMIAGGA